jgi:hypothetical protein
VLVLEVAGVEHEELRVLGPKRREDLGVKRREKRLHRYMYVFIERERGMRTHAKKYIRGAQGSWRETTREEPAKVCVCIII